MGKAVRGRLTVSLRSIGKSGRLSSKGPVLQPKPALVPLDAAARCRLCCAAFPRRLRMAVAARQISTSGVEVRPVQDKKEVEIFLHVPWTLGMKEDPNWVPPLLDDYRRQLDVKKSPFLKHGELACFTAFEGDKPVGRISVQIDREFDRVHPQEPGVAFFGFFDCP